ncbi:uncharacterized protein LOC117904525 isoform X3 [Vitis riparia]|uniref:uncharacterized protein LOC117904525 isoform X3 n=1 Tax=Vitis riparia TaxID=96939 RepID=UPI00155AA7FB|nr:uncharacterized protein LOC117904525 isoform X3 [Vitis riparia]
MPQILSIPISLKGNYKRFASTYGSLNFMVRLVTEETREKTREMQLRNAISKSKQRIKVCESLNALIGITFLLRYMPAMELGVLSDMPNIRKKACMKLKQQGLHGSKLLSAYKDMVGTSNHDVLACQSSQTHRLLIVELLSISCEEAPQDDRYCWSDELYPGEFDDLGICSLHSKEIGDIIPPKIIGFESHSPVTRSNQQPDHEILQVYLTTWLAEVNIDTHRVDEIFAVIGEEMDVGLS